MYRDPSTTITRHLATSVVADLGGLEKLRSEWEALFSSMSDASPSHGFAWNFTVWRQRADRSNPAVAVVREGEEVVGIAPMCSRQLLNVPCLEPLSIRQLFCFDLMSCGDRPEVVQALALCLAEKYVSVKTTAPPDQGGCGGRTARRLDQVSGFEVE
jgi:hypothetical protein